MKTARKFLASLLALVMILCMLPGAAIASSDPEHKDLAREAVGEGLVLLKNDDNALPLKSSDKVALFGGGQIFTQSTSNGYQIGGGGSGWVNMDYKPLGPAAVLADVIKIYEPLTAAYEADIAYVPDAAMYDAAAEYADTAIMFMTRFSKEGSDISKANWDLSAAETTMLKNLSSRFDNVIVLVNAPSMIDTEWSLDGNTDGIDVDALLITYMGGEMGAYGMADVLTGVVNPSGKLVDTYAYDVEDYPTTDTFLESTTFVNYKEDIYVGYRYFETFAPEKVVYPFGYGLSYTTFDITAGDVTVADGIVSVPVTVKNTGKVAGKEVVQVYYSAPQIGESGVSIPKAAIELAAYDKTDILEPNASQTLTLTYAVNDMASFDDTGKTGNMSCYVLEAGTYDILVGNSSKNISKAGEYVVAADTVTEKLSQLCPTNLEERMVYGENGEVAYETLNEAAVSLIKKDSISIIEAEDYASLYDNNTSDTTTPTPKTETFNASNGWIYNGTKWVKTGPGQNIAYLHTCIDAGVGYKVSVREAGKYRIGFVAANGNSGGKGQENVMTMYTLINGQRTDSNIQYDIPNTYGAMETTGFQWYNFQYTDVDNAGNGYYIDLPAGDYELVLSFASTVKNTNMNFDKFYVIPEGQTYTLQQAVDAYGYKEAEFQDLDLDKDAYVGIKYEDVVNGEADIEDFLDQMSLNEMIDFCSGHTSGVTTGTGSIGPSSDVTAEKYGIFTADTADGPAGIRLSTYFATYFPCSTLQACTWNTDLIEEVGNTVGIECLQSMVDIWLAPGMNIHRSPLCGRNFEYYSEDPLVTGKSAAALTKGVESNGVAVTLKHFCVNNKEGNRNSSDSRVSERALREIYLKGFEIAVKEADPECIMTSYNYLNGIETAENKDLLKGILRGEWKWDGLTMTDWGNNSVITEEINAGNNVKMSSGNLDEVRNSVQYGLITRETLEENTMYMLNALSNCPDYNTNQYKVHALEAAGETFIHATGFSRKSYHTKYAKMAALGELVVSYPESKGSDGHAMYMEFTVDAPHPGKYTLSFNYGNLTARTNVFDIYVNGVKVEGLDNSAPATGGWTVYKDKDIGTIYLPEGESTIRLQHIHANGFYYRGITLIDQGMISVGNNDGAYGETVRIEVTSNMDNLTTVTGIMESDATLVKVESNTSELVYNEETGKFIVYKADGTAYDDGEVMFAAYFLIDKTEAEGLVGDVPVNFNVTAASAGEDDMDECVAAPGYITIDTVYAQGDVNGDGQITNADLVMIARYIVHLAELNETQLERADIDADGEIRNSDVVKLARIIVEG